MLLCLTKSQTQVNEMATIDRGSEASWKHFVEKCNDEEAIIWRDFTEERPDVQALPVFGTHMQALNALASASSETAVVKIRHSVETKIIRQPGERQVLVCCEVPSAVFDAYTKFGASFKNCEVERTEVFLHVDGHNDVPLEHCIDEDLTVTTTTNPAVSMWPLVRALWHWQYLVVRLTLKEDVPDAGITVENAYFEGVLMGVTLRGANIKRQMDTFQESFLETYPSPLVLKPYFYQ